MNILSIFNWLEILTKNVIVLDGGGVRGLFALEIFRRISHAQSKPLSTLVHMVVGVSAGALVGTIIALGLLDDEKSSDNECESLCKLMPRFFGQEQRAGQWFRPKYDGVGKTKVLQSVIGARTFRDVKIPLVIICCKCNGAPVPFCSWDPKHADIPLALLLDASSAAPTFFPPVRVTGIWFTDGGVRANKPLINALLIAMEFFEKGDLHFLSIGTLSTHEGNVPDSSVPLMGIIGWLKYGIVDMIMGVQDDTPERIMRAFFDKRFLRLECACDNVRLDEASAERHTLLKNAASATWSMNHEQILNFMRCSEDVK